MNSQHGSLWGCSRGALVLALFASLGCHGAKQVEWPATAADDSDATPRVRLIAPQAQADGSALHATGLVRSVHEAVLSAPAYGTVRNFLVDVGDRVKAGQPLVELDPVMVQAQAMQARAARDRARAELHKATLALQRAEVLHNANSGSQASFETSQAAFEGAQADVLRADGGLLAAEKALRDAVIRAPFAGVIASKQHEKGEVVTQVPPTELLRLVDDTHLEVRLGVPEVLVDELRPGAQLDGTVSPSGKAFSATVRSVGAIVDGASHTVEVIATVAPGVGLRSGALVDVRVGNAATTVGAFLPRQVLHGSAGEAYVWVVDNGKVQRKAIKAEAITQDTVRVVEGLSPDSRVILADTQLREGQEVRVVD